jgi:hypothetical protein
MESDGEYPNGSKEDELDYEHGGHDPVVGLRKSHPVV